MIQVLPGIKEVGLIDAASIPADGVLKAMAGVSIVLSAAPTILCLAAPAKCQWEDSFDNNSTSQRVKLEFTVSEKLNSATKWRFVVVTVDNKAYLIGAKEDPAPVVECARSTSSPSGDASAWAYSVAFSAQRALIPCILA